MVFLPTFRYSLGAAEAPVFPGSPLWESPLPRDRHHFRDTGGNPVKHPCLNHGAYFTAARRFLEGEGFRVLANVFTPEQLGNIDDIHICLLKHGACYHPARITVTTEERRQSFVLNVALSEAGCRIIDDEVAALKRLGNVSGPSYVPAVYGRGDVPMGDDLTVSMFIGAWFEGYYEFHLSGDPSGENRNICVWGEKDLPATLSPEAACLIYHEAAKILTLYYNPETTEHISQWHHAAGDFVVKPEDNRVAVKLITVRQYSPLLRMDEAGVDTDRKTDQTVAALLLFFLNLSIRMRLDRLDGIGEVAWADETAVVGAWTGFLEGLVNNYFSESYLPDPVAQFERHLASYSTNDFFDLVRTLAASLPVMPDEKAVIERHIEGHAETLCETINQIGFS